MGGHPYWYVVPYQPDIGAALEQLRQREFAAGRYNPVIPFPEFPVGPDSPSPGAKHKSIPEAMTTAREDGTRSILDLTGSRRCQSFVESRQFRMRRWCACTARRSPAGTRSSLTSRSLKR